MTQPVDPTAVPYSGIPASSSSSTSSAPAPSSSTPEAPASSSSSSSSSAKVSKGSLVTVSEYDYVTERDTVRHGIVLESATVHDADGADVEVHTVAWLGEPSTVPAALVTAL